jgi:hypothetical protein
VSPSVPAGSRRAFVPRLSPEQTPGARSRWTPAPDSY